MNIHGCTSKIFLAKKCSGGPHNSIFWNLGFAVSGRKWYSAKFWVCTKCFSKCWNLRLIYTPARSTSSFEKIKIKKTPFLVESAFFHEKTVISYENQLFRRVCKFVYKLVHKLLQIQFGRLLRVCTHFSHFCKICTFLQHFFFVFIFKKTRNVY